MRVNIYTHKNANVPTIALPHCMRAPGECASTQIAADMANSKKIPAPPPTNMKKRTPTPIEQLQLQLTAALGNDPLTDPLHRREFNQMRMDQRVYERWRVTYEWLQQALGLEPVWFTDENGEQIRLVHINNESKTEYRWASAFVGNYRWNLFIHLVRDPKAMGWFKPNDYGGGGWKQLIGHTSLMAEYQPDISDPNEETAREDMRVGSTQIGGYNYTTSFVEDWIKLVNEIVAIENTPGCNCLPGMV
jgi:hypothetical protein